MSDFEKARIAGPSAQLAFDTLTSAVAMLDMFDWQRCREEIERTHAVGHILDPTAYRDMLYSHYHETNTKIIEATADFLNRLRTIKDEHARAAERRNERIRQGAGG